MSRLEVSGRAGEPLSIMVDGRSLPFTPADLTADQADDLIRAARYPAYLLEVWPKIREALDVVAAAARCPEIGTTPVLSAPIVRLLCLVAGMHALIIPFERFEVTGAERDHLVLGAAGKTAGTLLDWPTLGGALYRIADSLGVGGVPFAGAPPGLHFTRTEAHGGAFRLLCRLLLEHVDVPS